MWVVVWFIWMLSACTCYQLENWVNRSLEVWLFWLFIHPYFRIPGEGTGGGWWSGSYRTLYNARMEPTWSDFKHILRRHEEITEAHSTALQQIMARNEDLELTVTNLTQHIENLEAESQFLRSLVLPQPLQSVSINPTSAISRLGISEAV